MEPTTTEGLPGAAVNGNGAAPNGNFVLSAFKLSVAPGTTAPQPVMFRRATSDFAQENFPAMAAINPDFVVPGHCSGEWFLEAAMAVMPGKVIRPYVGNRFIFGART